MDSIYAIILAAVAGVSVVTLILVLHILNKTNKNTNSFLKVDFLEDQIKEAHEKLANTISYQFTDLITKIDDLHGKLEAEDAFYARSRYFNMSDEELIKKVRLSVIYNQKASASFIQRMYGIGYVRAATILDMLEKSGVVSSGKGAKPREVLLSRDSLTPDEYNEIKPGTKTGEDDGGDDMYEYAKDIVIRAGKASASLIQRNLGVGYARAARLLDILEENGVIGPGDGAKPREVFIDSDGTVSHDQETEEA